YGGDDNHDGSSDSATFTIQKAASAVAVTCPASETYSGDPIKPCSAKATGAGGLEQELDVSYTDNVSAGTAAASASYGGDDNHTASSGSGSFKIDKASSSVALTCPTDPLTYTGDALSPCTAEATGAGNLKQPLQVSYDHNTNAGTASASASYGGDDNHTGSNGSGSFKIDKASSSVALTCPTDPLTYTGDALSPCTAEATGAGGLDQPLHVSYDHNTNAGTAPASASYGGDGNHTATTGSGTFNIDKAPS